MTQPSSQCRVQSNQCKFPSEPGSHSKCVSDVKRCEVGGGEADDPCPGYGKEEVLGEHFCQPDLDLAEWPWLKCNSSCYNDQNGKIKCLHPLMNFI